MNIEILDKLPGTGKTYSALAYIENLAATIGSKWIYATEYLDEIDSRVIFSNNEILKNSNICWKQPISAPDQTKTEHFISLLLEPNVKLIAISHSLLKLTVGNSFITTLLKEKGYSLLLDETLDLMEPYDQIKFGDLYRLLSLKEIHISDDFGKVEWKNEINSANNLNSSTDNFKSECLKNKIYIAARSGSANDSLSILKIEDSIIFERFSRVILTTYQFKDTFFNAYLDLKNITYSECTDVICRNEKTKKSISENITFISKYNEAFKKLNLSATGYKENLTAANYKLINNTIRSIGNNTGCKNNSSNLGYTVPASRLGLQSNKNKVSVIGYPWAKCSIDVENENGEIEEQAAESYVSCNARATNKYSNKTTMVHLFNRFPNPAITLFLSKYNINYDSQTYAINELIQWVWRSAIRKGEKINLAILSPRMFNLFVTWLESE